jgi:sugar O-acyltransferase (sialic acid O-acetyltransferase NeuD family)
MTGWVILGGGGHARVALQLVREAGHPVIGYTAPAASAAGWSIPWLGTDDDLLDRVDASGFTALLGVGKMDAGDQRLRLQTRLEAAGIRFPAVASRSAVLHDDVALGPGTLVLAGAVVVTGSRLGRACIVNTNASVDHDCVLEDDVHVAPGVALCGGVRVGAHTLIGAGATVLPGVSICARSVVGAGATVTRDIVEPGVYLGTPARRVG